MLSGFVLSYAYQQRLDDGLSTFAFLKARIIRLYPLYILGTVAEFLYTSLAASHISAHSLSQQLLKLLPALFFVPVPYRPGVLDGLAFPFNAFAWTLFYELLANVLHATLLRRRSSATLLVAAGIAGILQFKMILRYGSGNMGLFTRDIPFGLLRVAFAYLVGMLLYRLWSEYRERHLVSPLLSVLLLTATLCIPNMPRRNALFDILTLLLVLPPAVLLGAFSQPSRRVMPVAALLGSLSYAIYILSAPIVMLSHRLWERVFQLVAPTRLPLAELALITVIVLIAWIANLAYDVPVRRWLRRRFNA